MNVWIHYIIIGNFLFFKELVFTCAKETTVVLMQSLNQQKISFKTLTLQIDNQLSDTPYPIMLSFDKESRGRSTNILRSRENNTVEPIFYFSAAKWRNMDKSLLSFESVEIGYFSDASFFFSMCINFLLIYLCYSFVVWPLYASNLKNKYY